MRRRGFGSDQSNASVSHPALWPLCEIASLDPRSTRCRSSAGQRAVASLDDEGDGAVVDQLHVHVSGKTAAGHHDALGGDAVGDTLVECLRQGRILGAVETGPIALADGARQRELAHHQASPARVLEAEIHRGAAREDAQGNQLARQQVCVGLGVAPLDPDQQEHALVDAPHDLRGDPDLGAGDSLDNCNHRSGPTSFEQAICSLGRSLRRSLRQGQTRSAARGGALKISSTRPSINVLAVELFQPVERSQNCEAFVFAFHAQVAH